ncbi:MAG TPA: hypothetical protein VKP88_06885 [Candidatus Paceibacterota bacterium]|nr:hypothetical protein [Candidatus Paceibacterota bacterium]
MLQDTPNIPDYAKLKKVRAGLYYYDSVSIEKEKPGNWVVCNLTTGDVKYECKTFGQAKKLVEIDCGLKYGYNG